MDEFKIKHLEFIENAITRMNSNSFLIKGWAITIISAILTLYAATQNYNFILIGLFPAIIFWGLDAYYLQQERKFRGLYDDVALQKNTDKIKPFMMEINLYTQDNCSYWNALKSKTISFVYCSIILLLIGLFMYLKYVK